MFLLTLITRPFSDQAYWPLGPSASCVVNLPDISPEPLWWLSFVRSAI